MSKFIAFIAALFLVGCASAPTVEQVNAANAARETKCEQQGYRKGTKDFETCIMLAVNEEAMQPVRTQMGVGTAIGLAGIAAGALSDIRVKRDIITIAQLDNGIHLYRFRYNWSDQEYVGVMAQEVEHIVPAAVMRGNDGYLRVFYERLGLHLMTFQEWKLSSR